MSSFDATTLDGERFRSKKAFREAVRDTPDNVLLTCLDLAGPNVGKEFRASEMPEDIRPYIAGPDPYVSRTWFANVRRTPNGLRVE